MKYFKQTEKDSNTLIDFTLEMIAGFLMFAMTILIAVMLGACSGGGGSSNPATATKPTNQQKPTVDNSDIVTDSQGTDTAKPFIWDNSNWKE